MNTNGNFSFVIAVILVISFLIGTSYLGALIHYPESYWFWHNILGVVN